MDPSQVLLMVLAAGLTPNQTDLFVDHVMLGRRMQQMAKEYGCSHSAVGQCLDRAKLKMQRVVMAEAA